jgi:hypothetical protein
MLKATEFDALKQVDIKTVSKEELVDVDSVVINPADSKEKRIESYIEQIRNPFCYICNGIIVKSNFNEAEESLETKLSNYFMSL